MRSNDVNPATTIFFGHSLGAQAAGEVGKDVQTLFPGEKLEAIYAADAAGPLFSGRSLSERLDPSDARWVEDIHTSIFGDPHLIATKDIYVIGASWNPITAHSQAWSILMQSITDLSMRTLFGDGMGLYSLFPGIDFYVLGTDPSGSGPTISWPTGFYEDPNDILGPQGFGDQHVVPTSQPLPYTIEFENEPTATLPAPQVVITQQLSSNLDWRPSAWAASASAA